uniref:Uncharacterized protein n=1 Tax=Periophthalmus magnuspinnatus TaxID=409849 RepID=A0A3B4A134_9GOBI
MENFGVYAVFGVGGPPQSADGSSRVSVSVSPCVQQVVLFSSGPWGERLCVNVELEDAARVPITIGKLTPYNKWVIRSHPCFFSILDLSRALFEPLVSSTILCNAPLTTVPPPRACNLSGKRKREQDQEGSSGAREENICPNKALGTPVRKDRSQPKRGLKLFINAPDRGTSLVSPSSRWGHTLSPLDPHTAILIGGQGNRMHFCEDPMWKLCTEDRSWVHTETLAEGPTPETRMGHTAVYDPDSQQIFMFGGSKNKTWFNDVHILDTCSWRWTMVEALGQVPPLSYHSCTLFRGELWVLGGVFPRPHPQPDECSDALYIFDPQLSIWYQPIVTGDKPAPRSGHSACLMQQRNLYVFGGWDTPLCFNDMHMLDLGLMEFSAVSTYGKAPSPRSWHGSAVLSDSKFLIHGGYNGNQALGDAFIFDTDTNTWTEVALPELHLPRAGHTIITMESIRYPQDEDQDPSWEARALLVFGGGDNEGTFYSDLTTVAMDRLLATL